MASAHNFRSAFNGFHREDVVHYIEYLNSKHANQVNQLESEKQTLAEELEVLLEKAEQVAALVSREMEGVAELTVPLTAEAKIGKSWYEAK